MGMQATVTEYAQICAQQKLLKSKSDKLRDKLIAYLKENACPIGGPFVIELTEEERTKFSWELAYRKALKEFGVTQQEIKVRIKRGKKQAGSNTVYKLHSKINAKWKG